MSLLTTCPHCGTSFNIAQPQLSAREGQVRCGRCSKVFDAYDRLTSSDGSTLPVRPAPKEPEHPVAVTTAVAVSPVPETPPQAVNGPQTLINPFVDEKPSRQRKKSTLRYEQMARNQPIEPSLRLRPVLMLLAAFLLLLTLAFQVLYYFRDAIVAHYPESRQAMESFCMIAQCRIDFLKQPDLLSIEASSLEADPKQAQVVVLRATLRNRAPFPQAFPALELTLNDIKEQPVARRVFMPKDYGAGGAKTGGIEANAELAVQIRMQLIDLKPQGYRLYLFYPRQ